MNDHNGILVYLLLITVVCGWFAFVIWSVIIKDGWRLLSKHYRTEQPASGKAWTLEYLYVGWTSYRNLVRLTTNDEGIFMELVWLVRFSRPRLFIPWSDFYNPILNTFFFWRSVKADIG